MFSDFNRGNQVTGTDWYSKNDWWHIETFTTAPYTEALFQNKHFFFLLLLLLSIHQLCSQYSIFTAFCVRFASFHMFALSVRETNTTACPRTSHLINTVYNCSTSGTWLQYCASSPSTRKSLYSVLPHRLTVLFCFTSHLSHLFQGCVRVKSCR